jgi:5-methylcytosine-specific restriction endonuclease McrA
MTPEERREYLRRWRAANPDKVRGYDAKTREQQKQRYAADVAHRERVKARATEWNKANRERHNDAARRHRAKPEVRDARKEYVRRWNAENQDRLKTYAVRYKQWQRRLIDLDPESWDRAVELQRDPCAYCGGPAGEVDHIVPVSRGGENHWSNPTAACRSCNARKHATPMLHFLLKTKD